MAEEARRTAVVLGLASRAVISRLRRPRWLAMPKGRRAPERMVIAPPDLRTGDPSIANDLYAGRYVFGGAAVDSNGIPVFDLPAPHRAWAEQLHGFGWLRHLRASGTALARAHSRALIEEWITGAGRGDRVARDPVVTARRLISWLIHAPFLLDGAEHRFARRFLRGICSDARRLERARMPEGSPRILAATALTLTGLCLPSEQRLLRTAAYRLALELTRQIRPDGGHVSRNPQVLLDLLLDLVPLRQTYGARNLEPPSALVAAIDRAMPMLRFFRLGDGGFASFNGAGIVAPDELAAILAYDDARGRPVMNAAHSGYQRIEGAEAVMVADTGPPPPVALSHDAHAGCLSFEFSAGLHRIVVNCGEPHHGRERWHQVSRSTAAHSTATVNDTSSARFLASSMLVRMFGAPIVAGPTEVPVERREAPEGVIVGARHDGYAALFGVMHRREWRLAASGARLDGLDVFEPARPDRPIRRGASYAIRFHLHPGVRASRMAEGRAVKLALADGSAWVFSAGSREVTLEDSVFLADPVGPRHTSQIVILGSAVEESEVRWSFVRAEIGGTSERLAQESR
jgi:uncharacterized heparinase superfamily protein